MIPKIIHYCWFGSEIPELIKSRVDAWKNFLPDYEIVLWNEKNYDVNKNIFLKNTYLSKNYAFTNDYFRVDILNEYGGIYMDVDMVLLKPLDDFLKYNAFAGLEEDYVNGKGRIGLGILGTHKNCKMCQTMMEFYENNPFIKRDLTFDYTPSTDLFSQKIYYDPKFGTEYDLTVFPPEVFYAMGLHSRRLEIKPNSVAYHEWDYNGKKYWGSGAVNLTSKEKMKLILNYRNHLKK